METGKKQDQERNEAEQQNSKGAGIKLFECVVAILGAAAAWKTYNDSKRK